MGFASVGSLGTAQSKTANQSSLVLTTTATLEANNLGVLIVSVDNNGTTDNADEGAVTGVVDSAGNTWTKAREVTRTAGAAQDGSVCSIWYCRAGTQLSSGGTITISFSNSTSRDASCATAWEFTVGAAVAVEASNTSTSNGTDAPSLNATTANIDCLRVRGTGSESANTSQWTPSLFWNVFDLANTSGGSGTTNQSVRGEWRISIGTGEASDPSGASSVDLSNVYVAFKEDSVQTLTPSLFTDGDTFHAPTVTPGAVGLTPSLFTDGDTFFTPTLTSVVTLTPSLFSDGDTFFSPTVTAGAVTLVPSLFSDGDTFFTPVITTGSVDLAPSLYADADTFHAATVATTYSLAPALYSDADTFHTPTVTPGAVGLTPSLYTDGDTFYSPTVGQEGGPQVLTPDLFSDGDTFFAATVNVGVVNLAPNLFVDGDTFYAATVAGEDVGTASGGEFPIMLRRRRGR